MSSRALNSKTLSKRLDEIQITIPKLAKNLDIPLNSAYAYLRGEQRMPFDIGMKLAAGLELDLQEFATFYEKVLGEQVLHGTTESRSIVLENHKRISKEPCFIKPQFIAAS